jgi:hypothetical protein
METQQIVAEAFIEAGHRCCCGLERRFSRPLQSCFKTTVSRRNTPFFTQAVLLQEGVLPLLLKH